MNWITDTIAIGSHQEAQDRELLRREGIQSVLGLITTLQGKAPAGLGLKDLAIVTLLDGPGNDLSRFQRAIEVLCRLEMESPPVLVHCRAGWSRSPAVVAGYLMRTKGLGAEEALADISAKRSISMVTEMKELLNRLEAIQSS
jgi:protein-tyrosine phosphatase